MKDANGVEIKIGSIVRHKHFPPLAKDEAITPENAPRFHHFGGPSPVLEFVETQCVMVQKCGRDHVPVHLAELVVVVG